MRNPRPGGTAPYQNEETPLVDALDRTLRLEEVSKSFGDVAALAPTSLSIPSGELLALLGPSGCGKTTTLRIVAGFETPDTGRVLIGGDDVTRLPPNRRRLGMVFQQYGLFPHLNVAENVAFGLKMRRAPREEIAKRVKEMLQLVRLPGLEERFVSQLSGGQQQRVALARSLITNPRIFLLDEPLGALDKNLREGMQFELRQLQRRLGITTVLVTHDQEEALTMSDRVVVMRNGQILQIGSPTEVYQNPRTRFVAEFLGTANIFEGIMEPEAQGGARATILSGSGPAEFRLPALPSRWRGGRMEFAVRPENILLLTSGSALPDAPAIAAEVREHVFRGSYHAYQLEADWVGRPIFAYASPAGRDGVCSPGDKIAFTIAPGALIPLEAEAE